jgi:hypothetical protein
MTYMYFIYTLDLRADPVNEVEHNNELPNQRLNSTCSSNLPEHFMSVAQDSANNVSLSIHASFEPPSANASNLRDLELLNESEKNSSDNHSSDDSLEGPVTNTAFMENVHPAIENNSFTNCDLQEISHLCESQNSNDSDSRKEDGEEENKNADSLLRENTEKLQFNPEDFDFDISKYNVHDMSC